MGLILDSSVIIARERQGYSVLQILEQMKTAYGDIDLGLSVVTIAELVHGAYRTKTDSAKQRRLAFIERLCLDILVYPITLKIARLIGRIEGEQASKGIALAFEDLAIGATALEMGFDVATLNLRHFRLIPGLNIVSL